MRKVDPPLQESETLSEGVWYKRETGDAYSARWVRGRAIEVTPLHPNTSGSNGTTRAMFADHFFGLYCRANDLAGVCTCAPLPEPPNDSCPVHGI